MSRTNIDIDDALVKEAMKLTRKKTKKDLVNFAVEELVRREKRKKLLELEGRVDWTGELDEMRNTRA